MAFRLTWSPNYAEAVSSEAVQSGFVTKNWDTYSFNVYAERYQDFLSTNPTLSVQGNTGVIGPTPNVIIRHLPSIQFAGDDHQIGNSPALLFVRNLRRHGGPHRGGDPVGAGDSPPQRSPGFPSATSASSKEFWHFPLHALGGISSHALWRPAWTASTRPVNRLLGEVGLDLRPPSLEKVFANSYRGYRLKHVIEPDIQYHLVREHNPENIMDIVRFDAMDIFTQTNEMEYSLTNTILARKDVPENSPDIPQARDIFSWRISQKYYFDPTFGGALIPGQNNVFASTIDVTGFAFRAWPTLLACGFGLQIRAVLQLRYGNSHRRESQRAEPEFWMPALPLTSSAVCLGFRLPISLSTSRPTSTPCWVEPQPQQLPRPRLHPWMPFICLVTVVSYGEPNHRGFSGALASITIFSRRYSSMP